MTLKVALLILIGIVTITTVVLAIRSVVIRWGVPAPRGVIFGTRFVVWSVIATVVGQLTMGIGYVLGIPLLGEIGILVVLLTMTTIFVVAGSRLRR